VHSIYRAVRVVSEQRHRARLPSVPRMLSWRPNTGLTRPPNIDLELAPWARSRSHVDSRRFPASPASARSGDGILDQPCHAHQTNPAQARLLAVGPAGRSSGLHLGLAPERDLKRVRDAVYPSSCWAAEPGGGRRAALAKRGAEGACLVPSTRRPSFARAVAARQKSVVQKRAWIRFPRLRSARKTL